MDVRGKEKQNIYSPNHHFLDIDAIAKDYEAAVVPDISVEVLKNVLLTPTSLMFSNGKSVTPSVNFHGTIKAIPAYKKKFTYLRFRFLRKIEYHQGLHMLAHDGWSSNYYHWLCDVLPRLLLLKKTHGDAVAVIPQNYTKFKFIMDTLDILDIRYQLIDLKISHHFDDLATVSTIPPCGNVVADIVSKMTEAIRFKLGITKAEPHRKVYISRLKAPSRKIVNEAEILPFLIEKGFEIVYAEDLSFTEQVKLFTETRSLVALHGGGLTNMMFMQPFGKILEIRASKWDLNPLCYWSLANLMELEWNYLGCNVVNKQWNFGDMEIDVPVFLELLKQF